MRITERLGAISDATTLRMLAADSPDSHRKVHDLQRIGGIRSAQMQAVLSMTPVMMAANIMNAAAILLLELNLGEAGASVLIWVMLTGGYSTLFLFKRRKIRRSHWRSESSSRATGKIVLSSILLAFISAYPALMIMSIDSTLETTFISITTAGMITGGALALYPVPFAAAAYSCILTAATLPAVILGSSELILPFMIVIAAFMTIVILSIRRQAGLFFLELNAKIAAEQQLSVAQIILRSVSEEQNQFTWRIDESHRILFDLLELESVLEVPLDARRGTLHDVLSSANLDAIDAPGVKTLSDLKIENYTSLLSEAISLTNQKGQTFRLTAKPTIDETGGIIGYHGHIKNITNEAVTAQRIVDLATRDHATRLFNYSEFMFQAAEIKRRKTDLPARVFLFIDADNLKAINDNFGHAAGDSLIQTIAERLQGNLPASSLLARKGGDEFLALVDVEGLDAAIQIARNLMDVLRSSFDHGVHKIMFSCCIGASFDGSNKPVDLLELEADRALYSAKHSGKMGFRFYDDALGADVKRSRRLVADLPAALEAELIELGFQPIVADNGCRVLGAEALLRWAHPQLGMVSPPEVLAAAKTTGYLTRLSLYSIRIACSEAMRWPPDSFVSVNMNASDFELSDLSDTIICLLKDMGFAPNQLWLELTESETLESCDETRNNIARLREAGIKIAVDDFGSGYSSMSIFDNHAFDAIKIDRALVRDCARRPNSRIILRAIKQLAVANRCIAVAEGVETHDEYRELLDLGYPSFQGFFFDKPLTADAILERLRSNYGVGYTHELRASSL